jgi:Xaa-Pro dipeptidase
VLLNRERALEVMDTHNLDALVAATPENVYYLSGFCEPHLFTFSLYGVAAAVLPRADSIPPTLFITEFAVPYLSENPTWMPDVRMIGSFGSYIPPDAVLSPGEQRTRDLWETLAARGPHSVNRQTVLGKVLKELGLSQARLGFDDVRVMDELSECGIAHDSGVDARNVFREIRIIKTDEEVELLRRARLENEAALRDAATLLTEGTPIRDVCNRWRSSMGAQGATALDFTTGGLDRPWVGYSPDYELRTGDHLVLDTIGTSEYYWSDVGRTGCVGPPTERVQELYEGILARYRHCRPMLQPGVSTREIKDLSLEMAAEQGVREGWVPLLHSLGVELYDIPQPLGELNREEFTLEAGMVVNLECFLYMEFPWGILQLEDTFLVTEEGPDQLGTLDQELMWVRS